MKKIILLACALFTTTQAYAMFCPTNFKIINIGDPIDFVVSQCGNPDAKKTYKTPPSGPQEWGYYVKPDPTQPVTLKMTVAFNDNKVMNITVNGQSIVTTPICGSSIQVGDTTETVKTACGNASFVTQNQESGASGPEMTEYTYNATPTVTLIFQDGKLTERKP